MNNYEATERAYKNGYEQGKKDALNRAGISKIETTTKWSKDIVETVYRNIRSDMYKSGKTPKAIIAGGEYQYAFMDNDMELQRTVDGGLLWRGIPLIRSGPVNGVKVVWDMDNIDLPEPPKGE